MTRRRIAPYTLRARCALCEASSTQRKNNIRRTIIAYIICNMKKLHHDDIPPVEKENERDENYVGSNKNIDHFRTGNNYRFIEREQSYLSYAKQRAKEAGARIKKDSVLISSMLVSASPEFFKGMPPELVREYFAMCYRFFRDRYGEENIVSAVVHTDETTPLMHLNIVPIYQGHRLCCKHLFEREPLRKLQTDIYEQVGKYWGLERGKQGSQAEHLDVMDYKIKMAEKKAAEITTAYSETSSELTKLKAEKRNTQTEVESLTTQRETLSQEISDMTEVKISADEPIPLFWKDKVITSLRVENAQLKQQLAEKDKTIDRQNKDIDLLYKESREAKATAKVCEKSHSEVMEIKSVLPREYEELLRRARATKAATPYKLPSKFNGNSK